MKTTLLQNSGNSNITNTDSMRSTTSHTGLPEFLEREETLRSLINLNNEKMNEYIEQNIYKDKSPAAKLGRRKAMLRAGYGEFICTFIFFFTVYGVLIHAYNEEWSSTAVRVMSAFNNGFQVIANSYAFSSVSGAHMNPAVSFSLWLTNKLSNRKLIFYIVAQLFASIVATVTVAVMFVGDHKDMYKACTVTPPDEHIGRVFATEFFLTFILTYIAFTIAFEDAESNKRETMSMNEIATTRGLTVYSSNPLSRTGFAPFVIGLTVFSLCLLGGASGGAFNPARMFGPAVLSGKWDHFHIYVLGQVFGASTAGLMVHNLHRLGLRPPNADLIKPTMSFDHAVNRLRTTSEPLLRGLSEPNPFSRN